jgi:peroxiredoxin
VINISKDLPFALGRFCAAEGLKNVINFLITEVILAKLMV